MGILALLAVILSMITYIYLNGFFTKKVYDLVEHEHESEEEKQGFMVSQWDLFKVANRIGYSVLIIVLGKKYREVTFRDIDMQNFQF